MVIGVGVIVALISLTYCFFGYRLARIILPLCGITVVGGLMYLFLIDFYTTGGVDQWIFIVCCVVALYVILFMLKRLACFFVGATGAALAALFIALAFQISDSAYFYPVVLTICIIIGLLSAVYPRIGVIIATSLFGACLGTLVIFFLIFGDSFEFVGLSDLISRIWGYLVSNSTLVTGIAIFAAIIGAIVQYFVTGGSTILSGRHGLRRKTQKFVSDEIIISDN